ncbi:MAG: AAA family ATPase [Planctomycetales bacterium]|nr:AAA family ATPase [Planctomycetales bacterium]NIM09125.1 AAA family ATPase [Planctomycetales bacterium]NIN08592.1 AAA family ATPase [Planctomycetales bacterium]NIN77718.1 AAA family ATPase [Planctomycetales bacterium]NIO34890.1 AAA family ATPase [Planctomycetales bacterium]
MSPVAFLLDPRSYDERPQRVQLIETHISWVFLTDRYAYKLKKPVAFEFLDFTTLAARRAACEAEVRLNRRLAEGVYLGVVPITAHDSGQLSWGEGGRAIDWVVKMRRLPEHRTLEHLIGSGELRESEIKELASTLANFYTQAAPLTIKPLDYRAALERHVARNFAELQGAAHGLDADQVRRIHGAQRRLLRLAPQLLDNRVCDGRIVEGHGDLRPEHIYIERRPLIIDCVEFSHELRVLDVADELCFLAMECHRLHAAAVGQRILEAYTDASGDVVPPVLLNFYKCYRACVRAKVAVLREDQLDARQRQPAHALAQEYLTLADEYARQLGPPLLVVVRGLMGTGKSTLAERLAEGLGSELLSTDVVRRELYPAAPAGLSYGAGPYCAEDRRQVYQAMLTKAEQLLAHGMSVVLDGTFLFADLRTQAVQIARRNAAVPLIVHCQCPPDLAAQRIADRLASGPGRSDARPDLQAAQRVEQEGDPPGLPVLNVDTTHSVGSLLETVLQRLAQQPCLRGAAVSLESTCR